MSPMSPMPAMPEGPGAMPPDMDEGPETPAGQELALTPDSVEGQKDLKAGDAISLVVQARVVDVAQDGGVSLSVDRMDRAPGNPPALGSGERFKNLVETLSHRKGVTDPKALAASIGRKKWGAGKMAKMAAAGRRK